MIALQLPDGRWEMSCWLPPSVSFYEALGVVERMKTHVEMIYPDEDA